MLTRKQREELQQRRLEAARLKARRIQDITEALIEERDQRILEQQASSKGCTRLVDVGNVQKTLKVSRVPLTGRPLNSVHASSPRVT